MSQKKEKKEKIATPDCPICDVPSSSSPFNLFRHINKHHIESSKDKVIHVPIKFIEYINSTNYKECKDCGNFVGNGKHTECKKRNSFPKVLPLNANGIEIPNSNVIMIETTLENVNFIMDTEVNIKENEIKDKIEKAKEKGKGKGKEKEKETNKENEIPNIALPENIPEPPINNVLKKRKKYIKIDKFRTTRKYNTELFLEIENIQVIDDIPIQVIDLISECFKHATDEILNDPQNKDNYIAFTLLPSLVLIKSKLTGKKKESRKISDIIYRGIRFLTGDLDGLLEEAKDISAKINKPKSRATNENNEIKKAIELTRHGRERTVLKQFKGEQRAVIDEKAKKLLQSKFPEGPELEFDWDLLDEEKFEALEFTMDEIMRAVEDMKKRSGGTDHLSGGLLVQILRNSEGALGSFTKLVNLYSAGKIPSSVIIASLLRGLATKKGVNDLRPLTVPFIADGSTTKAIIKAKKKEIQKIVADLCPTQVALAPRGAEVAALATRDYIRVHSYPGSKKAIAQFDLSNCFNLLKRLNLAYMFKIYVPFAYRYFFQTYQKARQTVYEGHLIDVMTGLLQGCGFGPLLCALALAMLILAMMKILLERDSNAFSVSLMDDMTFGGEESALVEIAHHLETEGPETYGAVLNAPKTVIYVLDPELKVPEKVLKNAKRIVVLSKDGFDVGSKPEENGTRQLGSPMGEEPFCNKYNLNHFNNNYKPIMKKIEELNHPTAAWRLWGRLSVEGGMIHRLRSTPPQLLEKTFPEIETQIRSFAEKAIFGRKLTDLQWNICQLPFALGGWNFVPLEVLAPCAYLSSLLANREAVLALRPDATDRFDNEIKTVTELILKNNPSARLPDLKSIPKQKTLVKAVMESRANTLLENVDTRTKALIIGQRQPHAALWKTAAHTAEHFMAPEIFQIAALFSIGANQVPEELCPVCKQVHMDAYGDHALICMKEGNVVHRHNDAYRVFVSEARKGCIPLNVEKKIQITPYEKYSADILLPYGIPGLSQRSTAFDLTITTNFNKTMVGKAAKTDLAAAQSGEDRKSNEHKADLDTRGYDFFPLAFEATGGHCDQVNPIAHYFISQHSLMTGIPFSELSVNFWTRLSVSIQRSNATAIFWRKKRLIPHEQESKELI